MLMKPSFSQGPPQGNPADGDGSVVLLVLVGDADEFDQAGGVRHRLTVRFVERRLEADALPFLRDDGACAPPGEMSDWAEPTRRRGA
jgi:hypothetical protein